MAATLVRGRYVLVRAELDGSSLVLSDGAVAHEGGVVTDVGGFEDLRRRHPEAEVIGNGRQFLIPGLVNAHHHGRGVTGFQMGQADGPLEPWIHRGWGRQPLDLRLMTLYTVMQMVRSGTTTVMHNQSSGPADRTVPEAEETLDAFQEAGMRVAFSVAYRSQCMVVYGDDDEFLAGLPRDLAEGVRGIIRATDRTLDDYLALSRDFARRHAGSESVRVLLSPQNYQWADEESLGRIGDAARADGLGVHTHLVETAYQRRYAERLHGGQTPAQRLREIGFLGRGVSVAHGVWLTKDDIRILAETGTGVSHNPSSNLRLHSGIAPVLEMLGQGVTVGQGTDSNALNDDDDMLQEMGLTLRLHRPPGMENAPITPHQALHMATLGGADLTMYGGEVGSLEVGRRADMALIRLGPRLLAGAGRRRGRARRVGGPRAVPRRGHRDHRGRAGAARRVLHAAGRRRRPRGDQGGAARSAPAGRRRAAAVVPGDRAVHQAVLRGLGRADRPLPPVQQRRLARRAGPPEFRQGDPERG